jgi:hypothetical protein
VRHVLGHLALLVILGQAFGGAASLLAGMPAGATRAAAADSHSCCKGMAPGRICPMHKTGASPQDAPAERPGGAKCRLSSGCAPLDVALTGIGSQGALVPFRTVLDPALAETAPPGALVQPSSSWIQSPPPRPPRA